MFVGNNVMEEVASVHTVVMVIVAMAKRDLIQVGMETVPLVQLRWRPSKVTDVAYQQLQVQNECQFVVETLFLANEVFPEF